MHLLRIPLTAALLVVTALFGAPVASAQAATTSSSGAGSAAASSEASHWTRVERAIPRFRGTRQSVSCVSLSHCTSVDDVGNATVFNGTKWSGLRSADHDLGPLASVSCPSKAFCAAVGGVREVVEKKGSWGAVHVAPANLTSVSCWAASRCRAVGDHGTTRVYDGSWHRAPSAGKADLVAISCTSADFCMAMDTTGASYRLHGKRWARAGRAFGGATAGEISLDCATDHLCMASTSQSRVSRWNGTTWKRTTLVQHAGGYTGVVSCSGPSYCAWFAYGGEFAAWRHGWGPAVHRGGMGGLSYSPVMDCPATARCLVAGATYTTIVRHGLHRTDTSFPPSVEPGVDCPTAGTCVGVSGAFGPRLFHAGHWTAQSSVPANPVDRFPSGPISCGSTTFCVAVGHTGPYLWKGRAWKPADFTGDPEADQWSIDCASPQWCMAGGLNDDGNSPNEFWDGQSWTLVTQGDETLGVQCPAVSDCWSLDQHQSVEHWAGTTPGSPQQIFTTSGGQGLSCPTTDFCVAWSFRGQVAYDRSGVWSAGPLVAPMVDLSCASPTSCIGMLAGRPGFDATYDGHTWTIARALPKGYDGTVTDISCAGHGTCMVVDREGNAFRRTP